MPATSPPIDAVTAIRLRELGARLRARRKALGLSAVATAEAAGMSRVTLHRMERGEPSVAFGAYCGLVQALGLTIELLDPSQGVRLSPVLPKTIRPTDYPQLKKLAWQLKEDQSLLPEEALNLYERNWRHVRTESLEPAERQLIDALLAAFGRSRLLV